MLKHKKLMIFMRIKYYIIAKKTLIKLTESDLHRIIKESVNKILRESEDDYMPSCRDIASAIIDNYKSIILTPGKCSFVINVGGVDVDVFLDVHPNSYRTKGRHYGYFELDDEPETIETDIPDMDNVMYSVYYPEVLEDDGSIEKALGYLLKKNKIKVDYSE